MNVNNLSMGRTWANPWGFVPLAHCSQIDHLPSHTSCCCSVARSCVTLCDPVHCSAPGLSDPHHSRSLPKFVSIASVMPSGHLILCHPLLLPSVFPSIRDLSNESAVRIRWPKYWSFNFSISPSNQYSGLLLAVQGTFGSILQYHNLKASILWRSAFLQFSAHNRTWPLGRP